MKNFTKHIDIYLKLIPTSIFIFLILNFIFNLGYFLFIGIRIASLLEIRDYYEGTAPLTTLTLVFFISCINMFIYSQLGNEIFHLLKKFFRYIYKFFKVRIKYKLLAKFYFKNLSYKNKKEIVNLKHELAKNKLFDTTTKKIITIFVLFFIAIIYPLFQIYHSAFHISKPIFWILCSLYLFSITIHSLHKSTIIRGILLFMTTLSIIFILGCWAFLRDYKVTGTEVFLKNGNSCLLIRPIAKGVITKKHNNLIFYPWEKVDHIFKQTDLNKNILL